MVSIVVAFSSKNFGIGYRGEIPWYIKEDMEHFKKLTMGHIVVMGRKTWESIPEDKRPLEGRTNIVITRKKDNTRNTNECMFLNFSEASEFIALEHVRNRERKETDKKNIYIIGGEEIYKEFIESADKIYATLVDKDISCDVFFPIDGFERFEIEEYSDLKYNEQEKCNYRFVTYKRSNKIHGEYQYLDTMRNILESGEVREDRTKVGTLSVFGPQIRFDISKSFPILTTKFVGYKSVIKELLFFLKGQTDSKILEAQGVNIWKANTTREFLDNRGLTHYKEGTMGKMYGFNWRFYGAEYEGPNVDYTGKGYDQLAVLIDNLKKDPYSRRHMLTTYNPAEVEQCVLAPCHGIIAQFYVSGSDRKVLSCHVYNRSQDIFLGQPWNISSYAALTAIIAKKVDMEQGELIISMGDAHIYNNHIEQVKLQLSRSPLPFPHLKISEAVKTKAIEDINIDDFELIGYLYHPSIKAPMAI